ncbi:DegV family protein [Desulfogranum mediterraneum]|uniref:DegV family protein n=1 Tax=Desulfogranum mediterraneum TaxID=160661 RepID=UPI000420F449|nr:DegV family protein [Desulfogranum mediterraneum]
MKELWPSYGAGYSCLAAWSELLDRINVFPVADGDTGVNLRLSLAPLREPSAGNLRSQLARSASGNSGNIAAAFFRELVSADHPEELPQKVALGRAAAWAAVADPREGTMLSVFSALDRVLASGEPLEELHPRIMAELQEAVATGVRQLPQLEAAGVVDAGGLGMLLFFEGFFACLLEREEPSGAILDRFSGQLTINSAYRPEPLEQGWGHPGRSAAASAPSFCVDAVLATELDQNQVREQLGPWGDSLVVLTAELADTADTADGADAGEPAVKFHIHTRAPEELRLAMAQVGALRHWSEERIEQPLGSPSLRPESPLSAGSGTPAGSEAPVRIVTDGAGSLTRALAREHAITLLDSYIVTRERAVPETLCPAGEIYRLLAAGTKVTTAQASRYERHQHYQSLCQRFSRCLYLCVGSAFTGNHQVASRWQQQHDPEGRLTVLDSGAASGRLALIALLTARLAQKGASYTSVLACARELIDSAREYVFIDQLKYLVAGGRVSRAGGFFADLLHCKPVVTPGHRGVRRLGMVHSRGGQLAFSLKELARECDGAARPLILLQYSDNRAWLAREVEPRVRSCYPGAELLTTPLSLTSGVHMGPGTWSLAVVAHPPEPPAGG